MKSFARSFTTTFSALALCLCFVGCDSGEKTTTMPATTQSAMVSPGALCDCGWEKGSDNCCKGGQEVCACGKFKGSTGCCK